MGFQPGTVTPTYELYLGLVHPEDREFLNENVQAALQKKRQYALDCRIILGNGSEIVCHVTGKVEFDDNDQPTRMLGTIQDITERKQVEQTLAESEQRLHLALNSARMGVWEYDFIHDKLFWSPEIYRQFGLADVEASRTLLSAMTHPDDVHISQQAMDKALSERTQFFAEYRLLIGGKEIWLEERGDIRFDSEGRPLKVVGTAQNITSRKQAEIELRASEQKMLTILDNVDAYIYLKDIEGKYLFANRNVRQLWGVEMEDIIGFGDEKFFDAVTTENIRANDRDVLDRGKTHTTEETNTVVATGQTFTYLSTKLPLRREDGSIYALCGVSTDITARIRSETALQASEERAKDLAALLRMITDNVTDMIWAKDLNKRYLFANKAICANLLNAKDTDEPIGKDDMFFALRERNSRPDDPDWHTFGELCQDSDAITLQNKKASQFDEYGNVKGKFLFLDVHKAPFINDKGEVIGVVGSGRDVTQQKAIEEKLRLASMVLENSSEAMFVTDADGIIVEVNPAFTKLTGYPASEAIGSSPSILHSGKHEPSFYKAMWAELNKNGHWQGEIWNRRKNGEIFAEWQTINTVYNDDGSVHRHVALFSDITEKKKSEELIWAQANFDQLTGLPNRRMFRDRLTQDLKKAHRAGLGLALMFLDLDRFKEVNDSLGHDQGDALLMEAAQRIANCVRESDTVARLGGDEFTIILSELDDRAGVERIATDILRSLAQPFELGDDVAFVSASIGITLYPDDATSLEDMLKNADQAMYVAKNAGRNRFSYFTNAMQEKALYRLHILNDLRGALAEQQLQLHYQPIVDIRTGEIHKAEALLRWFHPKRGLINPAEFIPLAEEAGLIHEIGDWVFEQTVAQTLKWTTHYGSDFQISINKSPIQIQTKSERCRWREHLSKTGLSGKHLVIEITEGVLLDHTPAVTSELLAFRDAGIQVAIDDFGTGYSALSYLKKLDIDYVKIDQAFILTLETDDNDKALAEAIVVMAHKLGLKVIAEGVETQTQLDLLKKMGCDYAQGFLYSRALAPEDFERLMENRQG
jgi:diguanylate cyclase (GGDEF)-like protein/PAS domain S-box-containing protein